MNENAVVEALERIERVLRSGCQRDTWIDADDVAAYLGFSVDHTRQRILCRPDFPKALRVTGHPRWKRSEVEVWADELRDGSGRAGRPRNAA